MLIVLIVLIVMLGVAVILLSTSRSEVASSTNERESAIAFYAAEAGVAYGKAYMSSVPYNPTAKFSGLLVAAPISKTIDYPLPNGRTVPASFTVTFLNNVDGAPDAGIDMDGVVVIQSVGLGPNNSRAVLQVGSGFKTLVNSGTDYCAQANPPPSCRGL